MKALIAAVPGGALRVVNPIDFTGSYVAGLPADAAVSSSDYSSVTLTWSSVENALGYAVYQNGAKVVELPAFLTRATIAMLDPGTSGITFEVRTLLASSSGGGASRLISGSTKQLPDSGTVTNVGYTTSGTTITYKADVLIPYGFVRLFIGKTISIFDVAQGWPIHGDGFYQVVNYLIEGNSFCSGFYKYTGTWFEHSSENADWSWDSIGTAPQTQSGYTFTWTVPLEGTDASASEYIIQCQGYALINNVFEGTRTGVLFGGE